MNKIPISNAWKWWFGKEKSINGYKYELEGIERLVEMERQYPTRGEEWLRSAIKKRMILRYKIKCLEYKNSLKEGVANE